MVKTLSLKSDHFLFRISLFALSKVYVVQEIKCTNKSNFDQIFLLFNKHTHCLGYIDKTHFNAF